MLLQSLSRAVEQVITLLFRDGPWNLLALTKALTPCPRGLRHAFGVGTLQASIPITLTSIWLGHASLRTTAIYTAVCGPEEQAFAERYWRAGQIEASRGGTHAAQA